MSTSPRPVNISADRLLRGDSLRDRALDVLRQAVVSGQIRSGELYSAAALARELGVSLSPVREAMLTLVNEGIMEPVRNRGFRVVPLTEHDLEEIVRLRELLEVPAVRHLADVDLTAELPALREQAAAIERAAEQGDVTLFLSADREFHLALLQLTGNRRLAEIVANLRDQTRLYGLYDLAGEGMLTSSAAEHRQILHALAQRDGAEAARLMQHHLSHITAEWSSGRL
jgi:DNA-binding GntR family transcriptional regulator